MVEHEWAAGCFSGFQTPPNLQHTQWERETELSQGINSQVKAKILLLLKEVVQDILPDEVGVQCVVNHFCPPKLNGLKGKKR